MPGNEAVDRLHNFFGQENLSQEQYHSQAVDGNWPGPSNNIWVGSQRSTGVPFVSNLKNFNQQQCDSEQGHVSSPYLRHSLNLSQSNLRHESGRNQLPNQQAALSGYMQGQQVFQTRQNGANILEMDTESDWHHVSRGIPVLESQGNSGLELYKKNMARNDVGESPVNFDFFGGQQQVSGRHNGMLQPLPRQHSGIDEMHLLQQQAVLNQMQELQRQQQFHQPEAKQQNSMAPASSISTQTVTSHSASLINGIPVNEASNFMWQPEVMATNANWLQRGASPVMHGSSNGLILSPEQGQALHTMGLVHNQGDQSLYGVPISGSGGTPNLYYEIQEDKPAMQQVSFPQQYSHVHGNKPVLPQIVAGSNSFPAIQNATFSDHINRNDGTLVSRQDIQGKRMFGATARVNSGLNVENLQQLNSELRIVPMQDFHGRQELAGSSEMSSQDKILVQAPPSQNIATLDPTEEKILFGSDDSMWDGFVTNTDFNMLDGTDSSNGFLSLQSGSWSALMQSAVAETSSSDMGIQEEWSGLGLQNMGRSSGNEQPSTTGGSKQQSVCGDNNLQSSSNKNSRPLIRPDDVSRPTTTENHCSVSRFHQSGPDTLHQQHDRLQIDSHCHRPNPQHLERGRWLNCSPQQKQLSEGGHIYGNATNSSGLDKNEKVKSDYWTHQQTISSCSDSGGGGLNKSNGWDITMSAPFDSSSTFETNENENSLQHHHGKAMHEEIGQVPATWEPDSGEDSGMNGITALPNSGSAWFSQQDSKKLLNADVWRYSESAGSYIRNDGPGKYKHHMENPSSILESSKNGKFEGDLNGVDNSKKNEKSADGLGSNFDGNDLHSPKSSGQVHQRSSTTRTFQNHPMGDHGNEVETYGNKQVINSQPMNHQHFGGHRGLGHSYLGQSKYGYCEGNYSEMEKGESESLDDHVSRSVHRTHIPKTMISLDRSVGNYALQKTALPRVHETESSDGFAVHPQWNQSSSPQGFGLQLAPPTQGPAIVFSRGSSDSGHTIQHMSETGDKHHTWLATNQTFPPRESSPGENKNNISSTTGQVFDKASQHNVAGNIPQAFTSAFPFSRNRTQNQNMAPLGGQVANSQPASLNHVNEFGERAQANQSEMLSTRDMSQLSGTHQICIKDRAIQILAAEAGSQPSVTYGASLHGTPSKVMHNLWTNVSSRQHSTALKIPSQPKQINYCEMTTESKKLDDQDPNEDGNELSAIGVCSAYSNSSVRNVLKESPGEQTLFENVVGAEDAAVVSHLKEPFVKCVASQPSLAVTSRDIEALNRSLRPNKVLNPNFSLLNQVQSMRNVDIDPSNREAKRLKVSDNMVDKQHVDSNHGQQSSYGYDNLVKDVSGNSSSIPSSQPSILCLSEKPHDGMGMNASSQEVIENDQGNSLNVSDSNNAKSNRNDHSLINPHMAPSWFEQYGTFKNVKILPNYDGQKITAAKIMDQPFILSNQSDGLHFQNSIDQVNSFNDAQLGSPRHNPMPASVASENVCSQLSTPTGEPDLLILRPKKRKTATSELLSWHKELTQGSERLRDLSAAELLWAQTANGLIEKVEAGAGVGEDLSVMVKSKRRLVLTTQVMQQLLSPPPAAFLVGDVKLHLESVVYSVSRLTLGEACSSISWSGCGTLPPGSKNLLLRKQTSSDNVNHYVLKVMDFVDRTRRLEEDILRLDSRASILDLRVECQDLERFSVINRFAKFHARGQYDGAETSSSSDKIANSQRVFPLQFVTAVPLPRNLPDRVQCLSL